MPGGLAHLIREEMKNQELTFAAVERRIWESGLEYSKSSINTMMQKPPRTMSVRGIKALTIGLGVDVRVVINAFAVSAGLI